MSVCVCVHTHAHTYGSEKTNHWSQFSPSTLYILEINLGMRYVLLSAETFLQTKNIYFTPK